MVTVGNLAVTDDLSISILNTLYIDCIQVVCLISHVPKNSVDNIMPHSISDR